MQTATRRGFRFRVAAAGLLIVGFTSFATTFTAPLVTAAPVTDNTAQNLLFSQPGQLLTNNPTTIISSVTQANALLRKLGIEPFLNPSVAFNCVAPTADNPLGITYGAGGAIAGPWSAPGLSLAKIPTLAPLTTDSVKKGQVLYGFVPAGITPGNGATKTSTMNVAWFNTSTFQGGLVPMGKPGETLTDLYLAQLPPHIRTNPAVVEMLKKLLAPAINALSTPGMRLAPVETGEGTILSVVFGTVNNGDRSCFFLPMFGITQA